MGLTSIRGRQLAGISGPTGMARQSMLASIADRREVTYNIQLQWPVEGAIGDVLRKTRVKEMLRENWVQLLGSVPGISEVERDFPVPRMAHHALRRGD